jgi:hypothetical protein
MRIRSGFAALALLAAPAAFAQQDTEAEQPPKKIREVYAPVTDIDFQEIEIEVERKKPANAYFLGRADEKFGAMIDERVHFKRDLAKSIRVNVKVAETATK